MKNIKHTVFWPPMVLVTLTLALSLWDSKRFVEVATAVNNTILETFGSTFAWTGLACLAICFLAFISPIGSIRLGGPDAKPFLSPMSWASVTLCTTTAVGILFWAIAEPMFHFSSPPVSLLLEAQSKDAARFALSTLYLHWTFTPCAMYALPALMFAFAHYNMGAGFSVASCIFPLFGKRLGTRTTDVIDTMSVYALVLGMAASLATGILTLAGGLNYLYGIANSNTLWAVIGFSVVAAFVTSAIAGIEKGVKVLSNLNSVFFIALAAFIVYFGPLRSLFAFSIEASAQYAESFIASSIFQNFSATDPWPKNWTVFYWAVWLAWAPITALFLGKIGRGYTVRAFLVVNVLIPAVFSYLWMTIFGGTALLLELTTKAGFPEVLTQKGPEFLVYTFFSKFPWAEAVIPMFLFTAFIAYVTAADSNTLVLASMTTKAKMGQSAIEPPLWLKILWGSVIGALAVVLLVLCGIDGIRTLSYLGGLPALFFEIFIAAGALRVIADPAKFDKFAQEAARPSALTSSVSTAPSA